MKKNLTLLLVTFSFFHSVLTFAGISTGLQLPFERSQMTETDADGHETARAELPELTLYRKSGSPWATSFVLADGKNTEFVVVAKEVDPATSDITYVAVNKTQLDTTAFANSVLPAFNRDTLIVTDHQKNPNYNKYQWEAHLIDGANQSGDKVELARFFMGNPTPMNGLQKGCDSDPKSE